MNVILKYPLEGPDDRGADIDARVHAQRVAGAVHADAALERRLVGVHPGPQHQLARFLADVQQPRITRHLHALRALRVARLRRRVCMSEHSAISWTDATFNPWWGCTKVSPACDHCYAERDAHRFARWNHEPAA
jgi:hypothetical protein